MKSPSKATNVGKFFFKHVVKYYDFSLNIVSRRDSRFTEMFWKELFKLIGMLLLASLRFHLETDRKT